MTSRVDTVTVVIGWFHDTRKIDTINLEIHVVDGEAEDQFNYAFRSLGIPR